MHWWHNAFSSSSSSSSSSNPSSSSPSRGQADDGYLLKLGRSLRSQHRRLTRQRRLRDLSDRADVWRSPSDLGPPSSSLQSTSSPSGGPQPLPLPELALLLRQDAAGVSTSRAGNSCAGNIPLPSPKEAANRGGPGERERGGGGGRGDGLIGCSSAVGVAAAANSGAGR